MNERYFHSHSKMSTSVQCDIGGNTFGNNNDEVKPIINSKDKFNENQFINAEGDMMKGNLNMNNNRIINMGNAINMKDVVNLETLNLRILDVELECDKNFKNMLNHLEKEIKKLSSAYVFERKIKELKKDFKKDLNNNYRKQKKENETNKVERKKDLIQK